MLLAVLATIAPAFPGFRMPPALGHRSNASKIHPQILRKSQDFHQANYYMSGAGGRFIVIVFRGEVQRRYYEHIRRIAGEKDGFILLLTERDLQVFIRQARNGKPKESHIRDIYDKTIREIS